MHDVQRTKTSSQNPLTHIIHSCPKRQDRTFFSASSFGHLFVTLRVNAMMHMHMAFFVYAVASVHTYLVQISASCIAEKGVHLIRHEIYASAIAASANAFLVNSVVVVVSLIGGVPSQSMSFLLLLLLLLCRGQIARIANRCKACSRIMAPHASTCPPSQQSMHA